MKNNYSELKEIASNFLRLAASKDVRQAYDKYVAPNFRHHNAYFKGDAESLMIAMEENAINNPNKELKIHHIIQEENLVVVHSCVKFKASDLGVALIHIFKFENNLIVELWDIGQAVPENSPNQYGMF